MLVFWWWKRRSAGRLAAKALAVLVAAAPAAAQTGPETPPASSSSSSDAEIVAHFVTTAIPTVNFITTASRLAITKSHNSKTQNFAEALAKNQTPLANSLSAWVNVNGPVVTLRSPFTGQVGPGAPKLRAPNLLPSQVTNLRRLSALQGKDFDSLYVSTLMEALVQLQLLYRDFVQNGSDPGLRAIATREGPKVEQTIAALDKL